MANRYFNIKWLLIAVLFTAIVVLLTHVPQQVLPDQLQVGGLDKLAHIVAYGVITFLFILSVRTSPTMLSTLLLFFTISSVATLDELTQPFVNRTASVNDWLADIVGVIIALYTFVFCSRLKRQAPANDDI